MERYTESQGFPFLKRNVPKCWQKKIQPGIFIFQLVLKERNLYSHISIMLLYSKQNILKGIVLNKTSGPGPHFNFQ